MPELVVRDVVIWTKHIHGDPDLRRRLSALPQGGEIELVVDGVSGHWRKMADGRDGRPTAGLTPRGRMATFWRELYASRRGESVSIALPQPATRAESAPTRQPGEIERTPEMREAALAAFLAPRGWSSEGRTITRDEMHER